MRYPIPVFAILLFFSSCADNSKSELAVFRAADEGLRQSINTISSSNNQIYHVFEDRLRDPQYSNAEVWHPKAMRVKSLCDSMIKYISVLRSDLKNEIPNNPDDKKSLNENDLTITDRVFESQNKGKELFEKLIKYRQDILSVDSELNKEFSQNLVVFANGFDYKANDSKIFTKTFFNKIPAIAALVMLSKFENNVKSVENNFILFCLNQTYNHFCGYTRLMPIILQSCNYVKVGDYISITAGVGSFSWQSQPKVTIDGKDIQFNADGVTEYKFKTPSKAGKYSKAVKMEYTRPDGTREEMTKNIEYTVIEPNQNPK